MAIEKERKFIFTGDSIPDDFHREKILQGYFASEGGNEVRVRFSKIAGKPLKAYLTLKSKTEIASERHETELEITVFYAMTIFRDCHLFLEKDRWRKDNIVIDIYDPLKVVVEVEDSDEIPSFCGDELTNTDIRKMISIHQTDTRGRSYFISQIGKYLREN